MLLTNAYKNQYTTNAIKLAKTAMHGVRDLQASLEGLRRALQLQRSP